VTCPTCHGDAEPVDDTSLYRCPACGDEFDEDELDEDGGLR
jgi:predicted RNA-binding Zn-ribbon protein involved in translation (DUF1610 family)